MTIDEAKLAKVALCERLRQVLGEFTTDTGLVIEHLDLTQLHQLGGSCGYLVDVEVRL